MQRTAFKIAAKTWGMAVLTVIFITIPHVLAAICYCAVPSPPLRQKCKQYNSLKIL